MATTPKVLLKRSSIAGRIPDSSDLSYGELAINFADGKLYYKDDANNVKAFIDSARVQAIADAVEVVAQSQLDSGEVTSLIDSAYVQARVPLSYLEGLIDSAYVQARQTTYDFLDSAEAIALIDSAYVQARQITYNTSDFLDSDTVSLVIDSAYVQARQSSVGEAGVDSAGVVTIIGDTVNAGYVQARQIQYYNVSEFNNDANYLDSNSAQVLIDSAYIQPIARKAIRARGTNILYDDITGVFDFDSSPYFGSGVSAGGTSNLDIGFVNLLRYGPTAFTDSNVPDTLPPFAEGNTFYFQGPDALTYSNSNINVKIGQDEIVRVYNNTGSDIGKGKAVYVTGAANDFPTIALAKADAFSTVYTTIGLTSHAIPNATFGFVTMRGLYGGLNTTEFSAGDIVHVSYDSAGELTNVQPQYPNFPFEIGTVLVVDSASGGAVGGCIQVNPKAEIFEGIRVQGNSRFDADLTVAGNLNILGSETITQVQNLQVTDNFIYIGAGDTVTTLFDGTGTNDGTIKDYYEGDSSKYYFVYIYDADSAGGGDLIRLHTGDSAGAFDNGTSTQINFDSAGGNTTLDLSDDRTLLPLRNNIKITFETAGGHDSGDYWYGLAAPVNQDLGIVGNYNLPDAPYSHAGFFRDADDQKFKVFNKYDPEVSGNINTSHASFELGTMVAATFEGDLTGDVTGTVSDISNHTTTALAEGTNLYYTSARVDSDIAASLTDSGNTVYINTTTIVESTIDSAYVLARVNEAPFLDSYYATALIDSAYVQLRQDYAYASLTGAPTDVSTFNNDAKYLDSNAAQVLIDSAYIELRRPPEAVFYVVNNGASAYTFTGDGFSSSADNPTLYLQRGMTYKFSVNASGHPFQIRVSNGGSAYNTGVTNNGAQTGTVLFTPDMSAPNSLVYQCTVHSGMVGDIVIVDNALILDSARVSAIITADVDAAFINALTIDADTLGGQAGSYYLDYNNFTNTPAVGIDSAEVIKLITANAIDSAVALQLLLDSSEVVNLIDSAYVQARQSGGEITIQEEGSPLATAATTLNFVGSAVTASGTGTTKTITISQSEGGTDSATVVTIIGETVDSAYVQLRQSSVGGGGLDSAAVISLAGGSTTGLYQQTFYRYQADSGQTVFTGTDAYGQTLNYGAGAVDVFLNGILLLDSADYTQTSSSTLTLIEPADSADEVHIIWRRGTLVTPNVTTYEYTATSGQTTFSGTAANGKTLAYSAGAIQVFKQGLLLKAGTDYTATDGTSVVLTSGATALDKIAISAYAAPHAKATSFNFTADSAQTTFNGTDNSGTALSYEPENSLVFLNGIALSDSDFTATNGTSVVLATAANLNDELKVVSFGAVTTTLTNNNWTETATSMKISPNEKKFVDVSSNAVLLEIQDSGSNVSMGDELRIIDGYGNAATNNITLRSTKKIIGSDSDLIIDINRSGTNLVYYNESNGWVLIEN